MKKNIKTELAINFQMTEVQLLEFNLTSPPENFSPTSVFQLDISMGYQIIASNNTIAIGCGVSVFDEHKAYLHARLGAACIFVVENLSDFLDKKQNAYNLPENFIANLKAITFSTTRGLFVGVFRGTHLHHIVLPLVDPAKL